MKVSAIRILFNILLFFTAYQTFGQTNSYKNYYHQIEEDLDLFSTDSTLGNNIWGLATLSVSNMRSDPRHSSELVTQVTMGTPLKLIEETEGWYKVETPEGYNGWMDTCGLKRYTPEGLDVWKSSNRYVYKRLSGYAYESPSKSARIMSDLVLGDIFVVRDKKLGFLKITTPDGRVGYVSKYECISWNEWIDQQPTAKSALSVARQMLGAPYLWGGTSSKAVDCSGLVKIAYFSQAIVLERDASQQAQYGESVDFTDPTNLQPGDLLFFATPGKKISHVGIYLENGEYIHASGSVHINHIDPNNPNFNSGSKKRIVAVKRIFSSLNSDGIIGVKYHPWYSFEP